MNQGKEMGQQMSPQEQKDCGINRDHADSPAFSEQFPHIHYCVCIFCDF